MTAEYNAAWRKLKRFRQTVVLAMIALVVLLLVESRLDPDFIVTRQLAIGFIVWAAFWSYAMLRYLYWRCPRCGLAFQAGFMQGPWTYWPRQGCKHCGLKVGA